MILVTFADVRFESEFQYGKNKGLNDFMDEIIRKRNTENI